MASEEVKGELERVGNHEVEYFAYAEQPWEGAD